MKRTGQWLRWLVLAVGLSLVAAACSDASSAPAVQPPTPSEDLATLPPATAAATAQTQANPWSCSDPFADETINFRTEYWDQTNFCRHSVPLSEFRSGGPPPDGIQPIDNPSFESQTAGDQWLGAQWPVIAFEHEGQARAYPLAMLLLHEIVNDEVGGLPVAVTYCPLCNSAIVFDRQVDGQVLDFGTTGNLRNSDLVMYDRQTQSWWQQLTGEAVVGELTGAQLEFLASRTIAWQDFKQRYPQGQVLSRESGLARYRDLYGQNPYPGLDSSSRSPFGVAADDRLAAMERVVAVELEGQPVAYPFRHLQQMPVVNDEIGGTPIVVLWQPGVRSAVDSRNIENSRDVGSTAVYNRRFDGQLLTFEAAADPGFYTDQQTDSRWNIFGEAVEGPLQGAQLDQILSAEHFWFAWSAFKGDTEILPSDNR